MADSTLARAKAGDSDAFDDLVGPYWRELEVHCYRMLGSVQDAEDALQETLMAAWRALDRFEGGCVRAWLYRIATNRCLNYRRDASRRPRVTRLPEPQTAFINAPRSDKPWWLQPYPDRLLGDVMFSPEARYDTRESIALSFVAGLQGLPAQQRAALVLRDVLGFSASEVAEMLETSPAAVNSALQRARAGSRHTTDLGRVPLPRSEPEVAVVNRFVDAFERGDVGGLVALLTDDVRVLMPPESFEFRGRAAVVDHLYQTHIAWGQGLKLVPTRANGQPAFGYYLPDRTANLYRAGGIVVLTLAFDHISGMTSWWDPNLLARFGLPDSIAASSSPETPPEHAGTDEFRPDAVFHLSDAGDDERRRSKEMRGGAG
jgi:RNA polymerase sigma-70 factor, ECF subfamily